MSIQKNDRPLFSYAGNKDREMAYIHECLQPLLDGVGVVVEPFGGSFALTRHLHGGHPEIQFIVNDIDQDLISIYNTMKDPVQNLEVVQELKQLHESVDPESFKRIKKTKTVPCMLFGRVYGGFQGLYPLKAKRINYENVAKFSHYEDITFTNEDGYGLIEKYKDNEHAFLFLDPPYVGVCNRFYNAPLHYKLFEMLKDFKTWKCKFLLILDDNVLTRTFAEHYELNIAKTVDVRYQYSKTQAKHLYLTNYLLSEEEIFS